VHTDGSATHATAKGGAGIYIQYPNGEQQSEAIPAGLHCSNYKAEGEAIIHAAHTIKRKVDNNDSVEMLVEFVRLFITMNSTMRRDPLYDCSRGVDGVPTTLQEKLYGPVDAYRRPQDS
jgi:ribonuclease HI